MSVLRRPHQVLVLALCGVLLCTAGEGGVRAAATWPEPVVAQPHRAEPAPAQRWDNGPPPAAPAASGNQTVPMSLRQQYPLRPEPAVPEAAPNVAAVAEPEAPAVRGFDPATSVERPAGRDAFTRVYQNADGTQTTAVSTGAVNFRAPDGTWQPVDPRLTPSAGGWRNTAGPVGIQVAGRADATALVRLDLGGRVFSYGLAGAAPVAGTVTGSTVTFRGARPATDVELAVGTGAVKETLVLSSAGAPRTFAFPLALRGLAIRPLAGGGLALVDDLGDPQATIPAGSMVDAAGTASTGVKYTVDGANLVVALDDAWLADPARRYPVRVDPSVAFDGADATMVSVTGNSFAGGAELLVGPVFGPTATYLKFTGLMNQIRFHTVYGAQLSIVDYDAPSCSPRALSVHAVTQDWAPGGGFPYPGPAVGPALATKSFAHGFIPLGSSSSPCPAAQELFDLGRSGRDVVQWWAAGGGNFGLSLRASATDPKAWKRIAGATTANPPTLYVTHSAYNADYAIPNPVPVPPVLQNQSGKVKVTVTNLGAEDWSPTAYYLAYRAYDVDTHTLVTQRRSGSLPATLARGARTTIEATIFALPPGRYYLDFTMVHSGGVVFTDEQVPPARLVIEVIDIPPVLQELYPPNGYQAPTLSPQLWARAVDIDAPPGLSLRFAFEACERNAAGARVNCFVSGDLTTQAWTVPAGRLFWSRTYEWRATVKDGSNVVTSGWVTLFTSVPQPLVTGHLAGAPYGTQDKEFDPQVGNYSTVAVDASAATVGPNLSVVRTYNSLDPRRDLAFGAGWTTAFDMRVTPDDDGSGNVVVTYADGQQARYGRNPDGTFAAPQGRVATLAVSGVTYTLADRAGTAYQFSGTGRLAKMIDAGQRAVVLTYDAGGKLAKAAASTSQTNPSGRALRFTWTGNHVTSVANDLNHAWSYTYTGDLLTKVCGPTSACTSYKYAAGSHYRSAVLDSGPQSYWRLAEAEGTGAASEIAVNLGQDAGTYRSVTLGTAGPAGAGGNTAATFNGTTSVLELPKGALKKSRDTAIELWFKIAPTQTGGPLAGYQDAALTAASTLGVPILYVGTDGRLRGQFRGATVAPITSPAPVNNNAWHHTVLSVQGDTQSLWLDGVRIGTATLPIDHSTLTFNQIGAAYASAPTAWPAWGSTPRRYFSGSIDDVAVYNNPLGQAAVTAHFRFGGQAADQLTAVTLPSGRMASEVSYNTSLDRVREYTDANGGTWRLGAPTVYGGDNDLRRSVTVLDPAGRPYFYEYDALANRLLRSGMPTGLGTREEDLPGFPFPGPSPTPSPTQTCVKPDPGDPKFCTILPGDPGGPPFVRQPLDGMAIRSFSYDANGFQSSVVNENGTEVSFTYNDRGNVTAQTTCRTATQCFTKYTTYPTTAPNPLDPRNDRPLETRDGRSAGATDPTYRTAYTYTTTGDLATQTNPDGGIVRHTYTTGTEPAVGGGATPPALLATTTDPRGAVTRYAYYANGDLGRMTEPSGLVVTYTYDVIGRRLTETEVSDSFPAGVTTTYTYDPLSRLTSTVEPATTNAVTGVRHQRATDQTFDADGNLASVTVRDVFGNDQPRVTTYAYDDFGRANQVTDPEGQITTFEYDKFGNRVGMLDANGNQYQYAYTARNTLSEVRLRNWHGDPAGVPPGAMAGDYLIVDSYAFDLGGRMVRHTDAMGHRVEYTYHLDDLLSTVTLKGFHNPDGSTRDYVLESKTYDGAGNLTRVVSGNGTLVTEHTITRTGQVASTTVNPTGLARRTTFTYDLAGDVLSTTQSGSASNVPWAVPATSTAVTNQYDLAGNLVKETNGSLVTTYTYDQRGLRLSSVEPRGNASGAVPAAYTTSYQYDERGQRTAIVSPPVSVERNGAAPQVLRPTVKAGYDTFGATADSLDEQGAAGRTTYDRLGRLVMVTAPSYTPPGTTTVLTPSSTQRVDALGNVVETTDPRGNVTRYAYDQLNRVVTKDVPGATNNERAVWRYTYTRTGEVLSVTDPTGARVESTYDDLDRRLTMTRVERRPVADNFTTRYDYDDAGNLLRRTAPTGAVTTMAYDTVGALTRTTDPKGVVAQYGYDFAGRQVRMSDGLGRTDRTDYDAQGRVTAQSDLSPAGALLRTVTYAYDPSGNVVSSTDATGKTTTYEYDALDQLVRQVEPVSATKNITTTFGYDSNGHRTRYTDGRGNATLYTYNQMELPESVIVPATAAQPNAADRTWTASYDAGGLPVKLVAPGGVVRQRTYDATGRLTVETGTGGGTTTSDRRFGYDVLGRVVTSTAPGGTDTYTYNDRGAQLSATGPSGNATFTYDADGQLLTRTDKAGTTRFTYDQGRLSTVVDGITSTTQRLGYDAAGQVRTVDFGAGRVRTYGFDDFGRLASDTLRNAANATVASVTYTFDAEDRMTRKVTTGTAGAADNTYGYDFAGRLTSWTAGAATVAYAWDDSGNRVRNGVEVATYDARDRLLSDSDYTYTYTARGTLATRTSSGFTEPFTFDAFDRLVADNGTTYAYDSQGRLAKRGTVALSYAGTGDEPVSDGTENYARDAAGGLLAVSEGAQKRLMLSDAHDDVVGDFDPADTTLAALDESRGYSPFGEVIAQDGALQPNLGFQGEYTDPQTGEIDQGARWYDPGSGTFLSKDPATYHKGPSILANPYTYGAGDPLDYTDPDGRWPSCGICHKATSAVSHAVRHVTHTVSHAARSVASHAWHGIRSVASAGWSAVRWAARTATHAMSWVYDRARAAVSWVANKVTQAARWVADRVSAGIRWVRNTAASVYHSVRGAISRGVSWARERAEQVRRAAVAAAHRVTEAAHTAVRWAVQHNPLPAIAAALKPVYSTMTHIVSAAAHLPAAVVSTVRDVVHDATQAVQAVYHAAVEAAGTVVDAVSTAARAVSEFAQAALPIVAGIAAGALTTIGCLAATGGAGSAACVVAGFAVGGAVTSALNCPPGRSIAGCAVRGGAAGAIGGAVFVATGGTGGGVAAGIISGAASSGAQTATQQYLDTGELDAGGIATSMAIGGALGGAQARITGGTCNSFAEDTRVVMADGTTRRIDEVRVGDLVMATDPTTGRTEPRAVTETVRGRGQKVLVEFTVDGPGRSDRPGGGDRTLVATDGHPFHTTDRGWLTAGYVEPGTRLSTDDGSAVTVTAVRRWSAPAEVRNLTVDGLHTYYVRVAGTDVLVHNCEIPGAVEGSTSALQAHNLMPTDPVYLFEVDSAGTASVTNRMAMDIVDPAPSAFDAHPGVGDWVPPEPFESPYAPRQVAPGSPDMPKWKRILAVILRRPGEPPH